MNPEFSNDLLTQAKERWKLCESADSPRVVKLALLRELVRTIHSKKSQSLGSGKRDQAKTYKEWEAKIEELRTVTSLEGDLEQVLNKENQSRKKTRILPQALFNNIEREKLERFDRQWEFAIVAEALSLGWRIFTLDVWVEIAVVEQWEKKLAEMIWPQGILLFAESATSNPVRNQAGNPMIQSTTHWNGKWYLTFHPHVVTPESLVKLEHLPGIDPPAPPKWKTLFSPKSF